MPVIPLVAAAVPSIIGGIESAAAPSRPTVGGTVNQLRQQGLRQYTPDQAPNLMTGQAKDIASQQALIQQLQQQASGQGPSLAQQQLKQATDQNIAQQAGTIAGASGGLSPGAAQWQLANSAGQIGQQAAGQGAIARLDEQAQARQALGGVLGQARAGDIGSGQLTEDQYAMLQNLKAQQQTGMNQGLFGLGQTAMGGDAQAASAGQQMLNQGIGAAGQTLAAGYGPGGQKAAPSVPYQGVDPNAGHSTPTSFSADGGVVSSPTIAGEAGPELIVPLTRPHLDRFVGQNLGDTRNNSDALGAAIQALAQLHQQMKLMEERRRASPVVR